MQNKTAILKIKLLKVNHLQQPDEIKEKLHYIQNVAIPLKWKIDEFHHKSKKIILVKNGVKLVVDLLTNNVTTIMQHPSFRKPTRLKREGLELTDIGGILFDPRLHTNKGVYQTHKKKKWHKP